MDRAAINQVVPVGTKASGSPSARRAWREVGWIFRDGEIVAIERRGYETRVCEPLI